MLCNTVALNMIVFMLQITCEKMKNMTLLLLAVALKIHFFMSSLVQHSHWSWSYYKPISSFGGFGLLAPLDKSFKCCRAVGHKDAIESAIFRYFD